MNSKIKELADKINLMHSCKPSWSYIMIGNCYLVSVKVDNTVRERMFDMVNVSVESMDVALIEVLETFIT